MAAFAPTTPRATIDPPRPAPLSGPLLRHARAQTPRYTSYPTALRFAPVEGDEAARDGLARMGPDDAMSLYVHIPFCRRLCWYCGCQTTVLNRYDRAARFLDTLKREVALWAAAIGPNRDVAHLHFGGGSPNALAPEDFTALMREIRLHFAVRPKAEIAVELDPGLLTHAFIGALGRSGVTRASLGVQTFDPAVQAAVNRVQPFDEVERAVAALRAAGVGGINFDLMYGLPGQTAENVADSVGAALALAPDRAAVFGYAHVPWMKKHQGVIDAEALPDTQARWTQAEAADEALTRAGYARIGLDHYARPGDALATALEAGRLRRNFQGYTDDPAPVLIPMGPSSIGRLADGFIQNHVATDDWTRSVAAGRLPVAKALPVSAEDRLRAEVIERLMCDLTVDVAAACRWHGFASDALDDGIDAARDLSADGLCAVAGRTIRIVEPARRLARVVAAAFDAYRPAADASRHSRAV